MRITSPEPLVLAPGAVMLFADGTKLLISPNDPQQQYKAKIEQSFEQAWSWAPESMPPITEIQLSIDSTGEIKRIWWQMAISDPEERGHVWDWIHTIQESVRNMAPFGPPPNGFPLTFDLRFASGKEP